MQDNTERILNYLSGRMTTAEKQLFEEELRSNPELKKEYQLTILTQDILVGEPDLERITNDPDLPETEKLVAKWNSKKNVASRALKSFSWIYLAAACLIGMVLLYRNVFAPELSKKAFLTYYQTIGISEISLPDLPPDQLIEFIKAKRLYETGSYDSAIISFQALRDYGDEYPEILMYTGMSQLEAGDPETAVKTFKKASKISGPHAEQASLYTGLSYLRLGDPKAALFYLTEKTGLSKHLDPSMQKLIRRVNLINTFQFKQLRKEFAEDKEPAGVMGPRQKMIFLGFFLIIFLLVSFAGFYIYIEQFKKIRNLWWIPLIIYLPLIGSIIYLTVGHRKK